MTNDLDFKNIVNNDVVTKSADGAVIKAVPNAKRQVIRINNIKAQKRSYNTSTTHKTKELLNSPTDRIGLFVNEYIPNHFGEGEWISYYLYVNGKRHKIQPINSNREGLKIIRKGMYHDGEQSVLLIDETIKSVKLEIKMRSQSELETPFISNIKLVTGKEVME